MNLNIIFILAANVLLFAGLTEAGFYDEGNLDGGDRGMPAPGSLHKKTNDLTEYGSWHPARNGRVDYVWLKQYATEDDCKARRNWSWETSFPAPEHSKPVGCYTLPVIDMSISIGCLVGEVGTPQIWEYRGEICAEDALIGTNDIGNGDCMYLTNPGEGQTGGTWFAFYFRESAVCQREDRPEAKAISTPKPKLLNAVQQEVGEAETQSAVAAGAVGPKNDQPLLGASFKCAGGNIKLYSFYETYARTSGGTACIGGSGGSAFYLHSYRTTVKVLRVWVGHGSPNDGFKAIQVEYFNGKTAHKGSIPSSGADKTFTFNAGEMLDGSIVLGGNGVGSRTGYLHFKTNRGRSFTAGKLHTPYYFPATGTLMAGFFGGSGNDIDHLGVYLFKEVSGIEISGVNYPTLDSYLSGLTPSSIVDRPYCNNTPSNQGEVRRVTVTTGSSETWSLSTTTSFDMTVSINVSAGVPEVFSASTSTSYKWGISVTGSYKMTQDTTNTVEQEFSFIYPAYTKGRHLITQFDSAINVPWEGEEKITFKDGKSMTIDVNGQYDGVYVSSIKHVYDSEPCNPCVCDESTEAIVFN